MKTRLAIKIKVESNHQSEAIQNLLFSKGYKWRFIGATVAYTEKPVLFTTPYGIITYGNSVELFDMEDRYLPCYFTEGRLYLNERDMTLGFYINSCFGR